MRRFVLLLLAASFAATLPAQSWPPAGDGTPTVTDPSIPLTYVGNDGSVSLGINGEGQTEGQLLGVFGRNNTRAVVGQLWWDRSGAGGVQTDFNWLWGMNPLEARAHPETAMVSRLTFALDQNAQHDRKATLGWGIERRDFSLEGYLARGASGARKAGSSLHSDATTLNGIDEIGSYAQVETTTVETLFESRPYGTELGFQMTHVFEPLAMRVHAGASVQDGDGARANTLSVGLDTPLGTHGWALSALGEHVSRHGGLDADREDRLSVFLRYEFGRRGSFLPTSQLEDPAWIARSLGRPSTSHPRVVESYRTRRSQTRSITRGPKTYTNHFPLLRDDSASTVDATAVTIDVLANDSDPDGDPLALIAATLPAHGTAAISGVRILYTPQASFTGADSFRYTASDGHGGTATAQVTVTVAARPNQPPLARNDSAAVAFGQSVTIAVLANDSDPDGDPISLLAASTPLHGTATVSGDVVRYAPAAGFSGTDRFTYSIGDGRGGSASATVTVTVAARPNQGPVAINDAASTAFAQPVTVAVLANDRDSDGDSLSVLRVGAPLHGTARVFGQLVRYTPAAGFSGTDRFNYTISDGRGGTDTATVTITVSAPPNNPPVAVNDAATTAFAQPVTVAVLANDSDPDGDPLTITGVTAPALGTAVVAGNTVIYTPGVAGAGGIDRFTYTISDGRGGSATATVTITIAAPPNTPPVAGNDAATTTSNTAVTIDVLANDTDRDGDALTVVAFTQPARGTVTAGPNGLTYTPPIRFVGTDPFTYTISDGRGGTASATVTVVVNP